MRVLSLGCSGPARFRGSLVPPVVAIAILVLAPSLGAQTCTIGSADCDNDWSVPVSQGLDHPLGMCYFPNSLEFMVADTGHHRVVRYRSDGTLLAEWGTAGTGVGEFQSPSDVALASDGNLYVLDSGNGRIQVFTRDGTFVRALGSRGSGAGQLLDPLFLDAWDYVVVGDTGNHRVLKFALDGTLMGSWGTEGTDPGQFLEPTGVLISGDRIFVADRAADRVQAFTEEGVLATDWDPPTGLSGPMGLAEQYGEIEGYGLTIADTGNRRVQSWSLYGFGGCWHFEPSCASAVITDMTPAMAGCCYFSFALDSENGRVISVDFGDPVERRTWGGIKAGYLR